MLLAAGGGAAAGALIGTGVGIAAGMSTAAATSAAVTGAGAAGAAAETLLSVTGGDPSDEINNAIGIGQTAIETVTNSAKIASQLQSKAGLLGISPSGDMGSLSNPIVQNGLNKLNNISSNTTSQIWSGTWHNIPVYEYIDEGIGVMRNQASWRASIHYPKSRPIVGQVAKIC